MSKRFTIHKESKYKEEWYAYPFCIKEDGEVVFNTIPLSIAEKVRDKLNEQQATIERLERKLKKYAKIGEEQLEQIIDLQDEVQECRARPTLATSRTVTLKVAEESKQFKFNKNCAKPYEIRSVSPNGVVRTGKKNSKVLWRMKDVREISQELPPFEDFNRETFQQIMNKFHTKFDNDVIGRIIYNIYIGTFEEYI